MRADISDFLAPHRKRGARKSDTSVRRLFGQPRTEENVFILWKTYIPKEMISITNNATDFILNLLICKIYTFNQTS